MDTMANNYQGGPRPAAQVNKLSENQMATLGARVGSAKRRLIDLNDALTMKLDHFNPTPQAAGAATDAPEPAPGTLAGLRYQSDRVHSELDRLDALLSRLGEIF